jgi:hypothetical protein
VVVGCWEVALVMTVLAVVMVAVVMVAVVMVAVVMVATVVGAAVVGAAVAGAVVVVAVVVGAVVMVAVVMVAVVMGAVVVTHAALAMVMVMVMVMVMAMVCPEVECLHLPQSHRAELLVLAAPQTQQMVALVMAALVVALVVGTVEAVEAWGEGDSSFPLRQHQGLELLEGVWWGRLGVEAVDRHRRVVWRAAVVRGLKGRMRCMMGDCYWVWRALGAVLVLLVGMRGCQAAAECLAV